MQNLLFKYTFRQYKTIIKPKQIIRQGQIFNFCEYQSTTLIKQVARERDDIFTISLIGRPNVGKSSLYNKLSDEDYAISDPMPGFTRDRKECITNILGTPVRIIDTAGIDSEFDIENKVKKSEQLNFEDRDLRKKMLQQTRQALMYSDLILFMIDAKDGLTSQDHLLSRYMKGELKEINKIRALKNAAQDQSLQNKNYEELQKLGYGGIDSKIMLIGNKCDIEETQLNVINDVYKMGLGKPLFISAENGDGLPDLLQEMKACLPSNYEDLYEEKRIKRMERHLKLRQNLREEIVELQEQGEIPSEFDIKEWEYEFDVLNKDPQDNSDLDTDSEIDPTRMFQMGSIKSFSEGEGVVAKKEISLCVVGRSNAGKSTLGNQILQEDRFIVDEVEGTTRDAISTYLKFNDYKINLIDTAGIDRQIIQKSKIYDKCYNRTKVAIRYSSVVIYMIDAQRAFQVQDFDIIKHISDEGRGILILVNKWDLVPDSYKKKVIRYMERQLDQKMTQVNNVKLMCVSAKEGYNVEKVLDNVVKVYQKWNIRVGTGMMNDWLKRFQKTQQTPTHHGEILKIRFVSQINTRPPTFAIFVNDRKLFKTNYLRHMRKSIIEEFQLEGVPIRMIIRDGEYQRRKQQREVKKLERQHKKKLKYQKDK